jgi:hypothetical protein
MSTRVAIFLCGSLAGCLTGDENPCARTADHLAECGGTGMAAPPATCDEEAARELLALECDELSADKVDDWTQWLLDTWLDSYSFEVTGRIVTNGGPPYWSPDRVRLFKEANDLPLTARSVPQDLRAESPVASDGGFRFDTGGGRYTLQADDHGLLLFDCSLQMWDDLDLGTLVFTRTTTSEGRQQGAVTVSGDPNVVMCFGFWSDPGES